MYNVHKNNIILYWLSYGYNITIIITILLLLFCAGMPKRWDAKITSSRVYRNTWSLWTAKQWHRWTANYWLATLLAGMLRMTWTRCLCARARAWDQFSMITTATWGLGNMCPRSSTTVHHLNFRPFCRWKECPYNI